jgi:hypothetical protein
MSNYVDTWSVEATRPDGHVYTSYGLPSESVALEVAEPLRPIALRVKIKHTIKATKRARWVVKEFELWPFYTE